MRKRASFFKSSVRNGSKRYLHWRGGQNIAYLAVAGALAVATIASASKLFAADDIQQIQVGTHTLYVPKGWMTGLGVAAFIRPQGTVTKPQLNAIVAQSVSFRPRDNWQPFSNHELPEYINVRYVPWHLPAQTASPIKTGDRQLQKWMSEAARSTPDRDGFVRVEAYFGPEHVARWEVFVYKASLLNSAGPLVVRSNSLDLMPGHRLSSFVDFIPGSGLSGQYRFDNTRFPESTWWVLHQHVLAFVDYLQTPK